MGSILDIEDTYDSIDRGLLWEILEEVGVNEDCIELLREMHKDNEI